MNRRNGRGGRKPRSCPLPHVGLVIDSSTGEVELQDHRERFVVELEPDFERTAVVGEVLLPEPSYVRRPLPPFEVSRKRRPGSSSSVVVFPVPFGI